MLNCLELDLMLVECKINYPAHTAELELNLMLAECKINFPGGGGWIN